MLQELIVFVHMIDSCTVRIRRPDMVGLGWRCCCARKTVFPLTICKYVLGGIATWEQSWHVGRGTAILRSMIIDFYG
jgi:hypothetical protein